MGVELKPWPLAGYTPGPYSCKCLSCDKEFQGDKRATFCLECSVLSAKIEKADLRRKLDVAREALEKADKAMSCGDDQSAHYCPNCDRTLYSARSDVRTALATIGDDA